MIFLDWPGSASNWTWNPAEKYGTITLSSGDLSASGTSALGIVKGTVGKSSGKWYFEVTYGSAIAFQTIGVSNSPVLNNYVGQMVESFGCGPQHSYDSISGGASTPLTVGTIGSGATVGCAVDLDNLKIWWFVAGYWTGINGVDVGFSVGVGDPASGAGPRYTMSPGTYYPAACPRNGSITINTTLTYSPPSGFSPW